MHEIIPGVLADIEPMKLSEHFYKANFPSFRIGDCEKQVWTQRVWTCDIAGFLKSEEDWAKEKKNRAIVFFTGTRSGYQGDNNVVWDLDRIRGKYIAHIRYIRVDMNEEGIR